MAKKFIDNCNSFEIKDLDADKQYLNNLPTITPFTDRIKEYLNSFEEEQNQNLTKTSSNDLDELCIFEKDMFNVLIRGAVKVEDNTLIIDDNINMNFGEGRPTDLVKTLKIDDNNLSTLRIYDSSLSFTSEECERIGLKGKKNPDAKAKYRLLIKEFNY